MKKEEAISLILTNTDYSRCVWYNKKNDKFCENEVTTKKSAHCKYTIYHCDKCLSKLKTNDIVKLIKEKECENDTRRDLLKIPGTPILSEE